MAVNQAAYSHFAASLTASPSRSSVSNCKSSWGGQENHLEQPAPDNRRPSSVSLEFPLAVLPVPFGKCVWRGGYDAEYKRSLANAYPPRVLIKIGINVLPLTLELSVIMTEIQPLEI